MLNVQIHKFGQPIDEDEEQNPVLHSFPLNLSPRATQIASIGSRLDLGVGELGIIGRTISILDARQRLLGQGIVGRI